MKLKFHRFSRERSFRSPNDFARFADGQKSKFEALQSDASAAYQVWGQTLVQHWASAAAAARQPEATEETIQRRLAKSPVALFDSALVAVARECSDSGRTWGAKEFINFLSGANDSQSGNTIHVQAIDARALFARAADIDRQSTRNREKLLSNLIEEHEIRLGEMLEADLREIEARRSEYDEMLATASSRFNALDDKVVAEIAKRNAEWLETHEAFIERLKLDTAVDLWAKRAIHHDDLFKSYRKWAIWVGVGGLLISMGWIFAGFELARWLFEGDKTAQVASYSAGSIALFTLFVWSLRVIVRSMISENHLSTDASARSALAHTYLALTKEDRASTEDRAIVLATLFAPVSDGLVKDDGMPVLSPTALAAQMITKT